MFANRAFLLALLSSAALAAVLPLHGDVRSVPSCGASARRGGALRLRGGEDFKESVTGITFSSELNTGGKSLAFVGAGERRKAILGPIAVNVYAIGLYVDTTDAKAVGVGADAAQTIVTGNFTKALRLVMARTVSADKIGDALAEQIEPRIKGTDAPLEEFKAFFKGLASLETHQEVIFTISDDTLHVTAPVGAKQFKSKPLAEAMLNIYLGDTPVSPNAKTAMLAGFAKLLA